jgi:hypothetical protein
LLLKKPFLRFRRVFFYFIYNFSYKLLMQVLHLCFITLHHVILLGFPFICFNPHWWDISCWNPHTVLSFNVSMFLLGQCMYQVGACTISPMIVSPAQQLAILINCYHIKFLYEFKINRLFYLCFLDTCYIILDKLPHFRLIFCIKIQVTLYEPSFVSL